MLGMAKYPKAYIAQCKARVQEQLKAYQGLGPAGKKIEAAFFNDLVLALELSFVHRLRGKEGKDGNALNEVRLLAFSLLENKGLLRMDKTINYKPENSVLKLKEGGKIALTESDFTALSKAYFTEIEKKFS